jgi:putative transposase
MDVAEVIKQRGKSRFFRSTRKLNQAQLVSHITQRAAGREPLFVEDKDYLFLLGWLKDWVQQAEVALYAFCFMPNHVHLLISPQQENLYGAMRDLFSRYARYFNQKYERKGHLFGSPYRQSVCLDEKYLLAASVYIHLNPVRAGLVASPKAYRWSSSRLYTDNDFTKSFVDSSFILGLISDDYPAARRTYKLLLQQASGMKVDEVLEVEGAINSLQERLKKLVPSFWNGITLGRLRNPKGIDLLDNEELSRRIETLTLKGRLGKSESRQAHKYLIEQLIARGFKRNEIADWLGVSVKTVYNYLN